MEAIIPQALLLIGYAAISYVALGMAWQGVASLRRARAQAVLSDTPDPAHPWWERAPRRVRVS